MTVVAMKVGEIQQVEPLQDINPAFGRAHFVASVVSS